MRGCRALEAFKGSGLPLAVVIDERGHTELEDCLGISEQLREAGYQTVGGMVMAALERVPAAGDRFEREGHSFEVLEMDGWRVDKVLVPPIREAGAS